MVVSKKKRAHIPVLHPGAWRTPSTAGGEVGEGITVCLFVSLEQRWLVTRHDGWGGAHGVGTVPFVKHLLFSQDIKSCFQISIKRWKYCHLIHVEHF